MTQSNVLTIGAAQKAAGDRVRLALDWGNEPAVIELLTDANGNYVSTQTAFMAFSVQCFDVDAPDILSVQLDYPYVLSAILEGGARGYFGIVYSVTLFDPDQTVLTRTGTLQNL